MQAAEQDRLRGLLETLKRAADSANLAKARGENLRRVQAQLAQLGVAGHVRCVWHGNVRLVQPGGVELAKRYYVLTDGMVVSEDDVLPAPAAGAPANLQRRALLRVEDVAGADGGACFKIVYKGGAEDVLRCVSGQDKDRWVQELHMADVRAVMQRGSRGGTDIQVQLGQGGMGKRLSGGAAG